MSVQTEITRIESAKNAIATAIEGKGVTVPEGTKLDGMAVLIDSIEAGGGAENLFGTYFETGSIVPASDITSNYTIEFQINFTKVPGNNNTPYYNFFLWCSIPPGRTSVEIPNGSLAWIFFGRKKASAAIVYGQYLSSSGSLKNLTYLGEIGLDFNNNFTLYCTTSKKLAAGHVYNWIALAPSSEGYAT